jgi:GxxExxY protein
MPLLHGDVTEKIIGAAFEVHRVLGYEFLEKVYQQAMLVELGLRGLVAKDEEPIVVYYKDFVVGKYLADLWVNDAVIVELKICKEYNAFDEAQLFNELKATRVRVGLLVNFGREKVEFKRFIL